MWHNSYSEVYLNLKPAIPAAVTFTHQIFPVQHTEGSSGWQRHTWETYSNSNAHKSLSWFPSTHFRAPAVSCTASTVIKPLGRFLKNYTIP